MIYVFYNIDYVPSRIETTVGFNSEADPVSSPDTFYQSCTSFKRCKFGLIADMDTGSKFNKRFKSAIQYGYVWEHNGKWFADWEENVELIGNHAEGGRGMELSELVWYNGMLLTGDDRTGIIYEFHPRRHELYPRYIIPEGNGRSNKGMKIEWMAVKGKDLYIGSIGKEYITPKSPPGMSNFWVAKIDGDTNQISHENWYNRFDKMRRQVGCPYPGYLWHEAVRWSDVRKKWIFLPRRVSSDEYSEELDERRGGNLILAANEDFSQIETTSVNFPEADRDPRKGFSSFRFIPGTLDHVAVALKSIEVTEQDSTIQKSFLSIIDVVNGEVYLRDFEVPVSLKFEGVELIPEYAKMTVEEEIEEKESFGPVGSLGMMTTSGHRI